METARSGLGALAVFGLAMLISVGNFSGVANAGVIEIRPDGSVSTYDGPSVFSTEGVVPIGRPIQMRSSTVVPNVSSAIASAAERHSLSPHLIEAVAWQESRFRQAAVSPKGAVGLMQLMPGTAAELGVDRYDLNQNVQGGAAYLSRMLARYDGNLALALAAYNAGPGAVDRYRGIPPFAETQAYVAAILGRLAQTAQQAVLIPANIDR